MTHQEKLGAIREACVAANPSIMALDLGCEIWHRNEYLENGVVITPPGVRCAKHKRFQETCYEEERGCKMVECFDARFGYDEDGFFTLQVDLSEDDYKVLGRPIRLVDVLLAMRGLNYISIDPSGDFWQTSTRGRSHLVANWNLRADSLEDQSPETISFIHSLLKP